MKGKWSSRTRDGPLGSDGELQHPSPDPQNSSSGLSHHLGPMERPTPWKRLWRPRAGSPEKRLPTWGLQDRCALLATRTVGRKCLRQRTLRCDVP